MLLKSLLNCVFEASQKINHPTITCVRSYEWKRPEGPTIRRMGFNDKLMPEGLLPRSKDMKPYLNKKQYIPKDSFSDFRAHFGQNDYIDILSDKKIQPISLANNVPVWLRGFKGDEFHMLLKKKKAYYHWQWLRPKMWELLNKRINYLYKYQIHRQQP